MSEETVGKIYLAQGDIETFPKRKRLTLKVKNTGDRGIQVGAHFHFFEANRALDFDREKAYGMKLDLPSGTAVRFEPGQEKTVTLVEYGGKHYVYGFNNLVNGSVRTKYRKILSLEKAKKLLFKGVKE
ncbi:MAG TPA: urease subunit beta [candidate division Zixibacteria bacterium]|nr:urease subunit beta [candidate division Zixibacteria bacterium]